MTEYANLPAVRMQQPFVPAGQSTQMIVGAGDETDHDILQSAQSLYRDMRMKRVFYSAYVPINRPHPLAPVLRCRSNGSTGYTRPTGCCAFMALMRRNCWPRTKS